MFIFPFFIINLISTKSHSLPTLSGPICALHRAHHTRSHQFSMPILEIYILAAVVECLHLLLSLHELLHGQLQEIAESENEYRRENERWAASAEWLCVSNHENCGNEQQHYGHDRRHWLIGAERKTELNIWKPSGRKRTLSYITVFNIYGTFVCTLEYTETRLSMNRWLAISSRQIICFVVFIQKRRWKRNLYRRLSFFRRFNLDDYKLYVEKF